MWPLYEDIIALIGYIVFSVHRPINGNTDMFTKPFQRIIDFMLIHKAYFSVELLDKMYFKLKVKNLNYENSYKISFFLTSHVK
jgi:hypothetical protein